MIASVRGLVLAVSGTSATIEIGGVGLDVTLTPERALSLRVGSEARLSTTLVVREDELTLYGFDNNDERSVFDLLCSVTGVGPKSAMGVLAVMTPDDVAQAVASENDSAFRKVSGIGPKTAKLIVLSLTGKIAAVAPRASASPSSASTSVTDSVVAALVGLGWTEKVAAQAVDQASDGAPESEQSNVSALLRRSLGQLGPAGATRGSETGTR